MSRKGAQLGRLAAMMATTALATPAVVRRLRPHVGDHGVRTLHFANYHLRDVLSDVMRVTVRPYQGPRAHMFVRGEQVLAEFGNAESGSLPMDLVVTASTRLMELRDVPTTYLAQMGFNTVEDLMMAMRQHYPSLDLGMGTIVACIEFERGFDVGGPLLRI